MCLVGGLEWAPKARESPKENSCRVEVGLVKGGYKWSADSDSHNGL